MKKKFFIPKEICKYILIKIYQNDWVEIVNYSVLAIIIQKKRKIKDFITIVDVYDEYIRKAKLLMEKKNSDYEDAWKYMSISSIKDLILQKIFRIQGIEKRLSEVDNFYDKIQDNYMDILNYAILSLIKMKNP
ncbi:DUF1599 domain-containing protein [Blattabacterium sp. (Mastotermes darwiniensis)]|jgi:hypothetical protein|uniref:DUF1599 domain-containing protein n=1 Tax=Blattabacterium sp. (Mastotermes darwiniensis) TaxID=39768 RepID=UPI0002FB3032|nr:DUF1599 domain-containing protein [Blattabacterium sp. (Mastotermes darwiniensis)]